MRSGSRGFFLLLGCFLLAGCVHENQALLRQEALDNAMSSRLALTAWPKNRLQPETWHFCHVCPLPTAPQRVSRTIKAKPQKRAHRTRKVTKPAASFGPLDSSTVNPLHSHS